MTPGIIKENFIPVDLEQLEAVVLEKDNSNDQRFLFEAFKAFLPIELQVPGFREDVLVNKRTTALDYSIYYCVVILDGYQLFIGLLCHLNIDKVYVFNAKSTDDSSYCQVTLSSIFKNSDFITIKVLLNLIVESLEL
jgi:hypothetical protein